MAFTDLHTRHAPRHLTTQDFKYVHVTIFRSEMKYCHAILTGDKKIRKHKHESGNVLWRESRAKCIFSAFVMKVCSLMN